MTRVASARWMEGGVRRPSVRPLGRSDDGDRFSSSIEEAVQRALAERTSAPERREGVLTLVLGGDDAPATDVESDAATTTMESSFAAFTLVPATFEADAPLETPSTPSLAPQGVVDEDAQGLADKALELAAMPPSLAPAASDATPRASVPGERTTPVPRLSREDESGVRALFHALARPLAEAAASIEAAAPQTPPAALPLAAPDALESAPVHHEHARAHVEHAERRAHVDERPEHAPHRAVAHASARDTRSDDPTTPTRSVESAPLAEPHTVEEMVHEPTPTAVAHVAPEIPVAAPAETRPATIARPLTHDLAPPIAEPSEDEAAVPLEHVRYAALDTDHAKVELAHPTLGRLELEVRGEGPAVDVTMLTRSLGASIALRAAEASLRSDLGRRSTELRTYRVRTDASASGSSTPSDDDDEETT